MSEGRTHSANHLQAPPLRKRWIKSTTSSHYLDQDEEYGPINFTEIRPLFKNLRSRDITHFDEILTEYARRRREWNRNRGSRGTSK